MARRESGWGLSLVLWFQSWRRPLITNLALIFHYASHENVFAVLIPLIVWCVDAELGRYMIIILAFNGWLNRLLKLTLRGPRPSDLSPQVKPALTIDDNYGIPSAHTQVATVFLSMIALYVDRPWVTAMAALYIVLTGFSRILLGVHFPGDIAGATVAGLALAAVSFWLYQPLTGWLTTQSFLVQISAVAGLCAALTAIYPLIIYPSSKEELNTVVMLQGALLGMGIGLIVETHFVHFTADGTWLLRLGRLAIGLTGIFVLRDGPKLLFAHQDSHWILRFARYALVGVWLTFAAPWVFVMLGLAHSTLSP